MPTPTAAASRHWSSPDPRPALHHELRLTPSQYRNSCPSPGPDSSPINLRRAQASHQLTRCERLTSRSHAALFLLQASSRSRIQRHQHRQSIETSITSLHFQPLPAQALPYSQPASQAIPLRPQGGINRLHRALQSPPLTRALRLCDILAPPPLITATSRRSPTVACLSLLYYSSSCCAMLLVHVVQID